VSENPIRDEELVTVFASSNFDAESEADIVYGLLTSSGIEAIIMRQNVPELPTGVVEVRVLESQAQEARELIASSTGESEGGEE
jgi:hypothetical protein